MIRAGDLDRRITIKTVNLVNDTVGHPKPTATTLASNVPARVIPYRGKEKFSEEQAQRELSYRINKFLIRYRNDINPKCQIVYDGLTWDIVYISEYGKREGLEIVAEVTK